MGNFPRVIKGLSRLLFALDTPLHPAQSMLQKTPLAEALAEETAVVAVPLHPVTVVQDVEVTVVEDETETTCVQDGNVELEHEDAALVLLG